MSTQLTPGITIFNSPEDDTLGEFIKLLDSAGRSIHLADYSFNIMEVVDVLVAKLKIGIDAAGVPTVIVESELYQIMHNKFTLVDGHITLDGSWNFTTAASKENNNYFIFDDNDLSFKVCPVYEKVFEDMWQGKTTIIESKIT